MARLKPASPHVVAGVLTVYVRIGITEAVRHLIPLCDFAQTCPALRHLQEGNLLDEVSGNFRSSRINPASIEIGFRLVHRVRTFLPKSGRTPDVGLRFLENSGGEGVFASCARRSILLECLICDPAVEPCAMRGRSKQWLVVAADQQHTTISAIFNVSGVLPRTNSVPAAARREHGDLRYRNHHRHRRPRIPLMPARTIKAIRNEARSFALDFNGSPLSRIR